MAANQLWRWRALTKDGEPRSGTLWATDRNAAFTRLMRNDLHPLTLTRCAQRHRWRPHHCDEMFHQLASLLQAGLTLSHSLQMLAEQHPLKPWQALLQSIADELSEGCPFSESLKKWPAVFSPLHVSMVKTGELTGKLEVCCRQLAQQQKAQQQLSAKVKKALRYPAIVLTLAVLVVLAMVTLVLPEFAAIYKTFNTPLPVLTQMVMGMAAFMQSYALALFVLLLSPLSRRLGSAAESSLAVHPAAYARDGRTGKRSKAGTRLYRAVTHATGGYPLFTGPGECRGDR